MTPGHSVRSQWESNIKMLEKTRLCSVTVDWISSVKYHKWDKSRLQGHLAQCKAHTTKGKGWFAPGFGSKFPF